jgi:predicted SprT family Zn-dependent metalloprotease
MADTTWVEQRAAALLRQHKLPDWSFEFDHAKTRFGQCDHRRRRITLSRYLSATGSNDEVEQVILHEIAHALAGSREGHGQTWLRIARSLGYRGGRTHSAEVPIDQAKWRGRCPVGHEVIRFRKPARKMSCAKCSTRFSDDYLIVWHERTYSSMDTSFQNAT